MTTTARGIQVQFGPRSTRTATPHRFSVDPAAPGTCQRCHLIKGHRLHSPDEVAKAEAERDAAAAEERRRLGEPD